MNKEAILKWIKENVSGKNTYGDIGLTILDNNIADLLEDFLTDAIAQMM